MKSIEMFVDVPDWFDKEIHTLEDVIQSRIQQAEAVPEGLIDFLDFSIKSKEGMLRIPEVAEHIRDLERWKRGLLSVPTQSEQPEGEALTPGVRVITPDGAGTLLEIELETAAVDLDDGNGLPYYYMQEKVRKAPPTPQPAEQAGVPEYWEVRFVEGMKSGALVFGEWKRSTTEAGRSAYIEKCKAAVEGGIRNEWIETRELYSSPITSDKGAVPEDIESVLIACNIPTGYHQTIIDECARRKPAQSEQPEGEIKWIAEQLNIVAKVRDEDYPGQGANYDELTTHWFNAYNRLRERVNGLLSTVAGKANPTPQPAEQAIDRKAAAEFLAGSPSARLRKTGEHELRMIEAEQLELEKDAARWRLASTSRNFGIVDYTEHGARFIHDVLAESVIDRALLAAAEQGSGTP